MKLSFSIEFEKMGHDPKLLPEKPGVYLFKKGQDYLYIGKSQNLRHRLSNPSHIPFLIAREMKNVDMYYCLTEHFDIELFLIQKYKPIWNGKITNAKSRKSYVIYDENLNGNWLYHALGWYCDVNCYKQTNSQDIASFLPDGKNNIIQYQHILDNTLGKKEAVSNLSFLG